MSNQSQPFKVSKPPFRKLRGYAFDPIVSLDLDTADINEITYEIPWESNLKPGPEGEYIHVIDRDPASDAVYAPVNLNASELLATNGLAPTESNPQFHQQMVYAVIMTTIRNFEKALGRPVLWSPRQGTSEGKSTFKYVPKLLVYPHAIRDQNAYYSPDRKALLFGYYKATPADASLYLPGAIVYACLSHDIVAHETTHALLDGIHSRFMESTHPDVPAFHEGFADLVALLQHFMHPEIVRNQVRKVHADLNLETLLFQLALEFGQSTGQRSALRDASGTITDDGNWIRRLPNTSDYNTILECHDRGNLLVATIFDAFIAIYKNRTADLLRIATGGTGVLPAGDIHPDLVNRLATEAVKTASHVLSMCVRALDYCPPVDLTYGDYLRALITADFELVADDDLHYRIAVINAFRKRGIYPSGVPNLSVDSLRYDVLENEDAKSWFRGAVLDFLRPFKEQLAYETNRERIFTTTSDFIRGDKKKKIKGFHEYLFGPEGLMSNPVLAEHLTGLVFSPQYEALGIGTSKTYGNGPSVEIHSLRLNNRVGPDGNTLNQIVMTLCQRCRVLPKKNSSGDLHFTPLPGGKASDNPDSFIFRGGCTLIFDLNDLCLKHAISKPIFNTGPGRGRKLTLNTARLTMQYNCTSGDLAEEMGITANPPKGSEFFAHLHKSKLADYAW
ncbi:MAG TPA: hypothetical protein VGM31_22395 [Puia sp.]